MLDDQTDEIVRFFSGQKSSLPSGALEVTDASRLLNFICRKGRLRKIWGAPIYAQPVLPPNGSGGVSWISLFKRRWFFQQGTLIAFETAEGSKNFQEVGTILLGGTNRVESEKWRNLIFLVNGVENKIYDDSGVAGQKYLNLGLYPPGHGLRASISLQPTFTLTESGGGDHPEGTYQYLVTFLDNNRGIESLPNGAEVQEDGLWLGNAPVSITTSAANKKIDGNIADLKAAGVDPRVTHFVVYRATQVDGQFKRITNGPFAIAADTFQDNDGDDTNLGQVLDESISPPPSGKYYLTGNDTENYGPRFVKFFRDQLWLFGVRYPGLGDLGFGEVTGLAYGSAVNNFDYWKYEYDVGRSTDQEDTGIGKYRNTLFFFKEQSAYYLDGTNPTNYQIKEMDPQRGVVAPGSLQDTPVGCIGLAADGFVLFDSASPGKLISEEIQDEIDSINFDHVDKIHSAYDPKEGKYECYVPRSPSVNISRVFIYDVNMKTWQFLSTRIGQAAAYGISSQKRRVGLLGDSQNSRLYDLANEAATTFGGTGLANGQTIRARFESKHFDWQAPGKLKRLQFIKIKARTKTDLKLSIDIIPDFGQQETITLDALEPVAEFSTWAESASDEDGMVWDQSNWAGATVPVKFEIPIQVVARNVQLVIREAETSADRASFEIEEIILEANLLGR
jgi:hypothetical protein